MRYIAITCDIVRSRQINKAYELEQSLRHALLELNRQLAPKVPFTITVWDEFQALFTCPFGFRQSILTIFSQLPSYKLRVGVGYGSIDTPPSESTRFMYGVALIRSREALELTRNSGFSIRFVGDDKPVSIRLDCLFKLLSATLDRLTDRQRRRLIFYELSGDLELVARKEGVTTRAVRQSIKSGRFYWQLFKENLTLVDYLLKKLI